MLSLGAGFTFAIGTQLLNMGLRHGDPQTGTLLDISAAALVYYLFSPFFVESWFWLTMGTAVFVAIGVLRPFVSSSLAARSIHYVGPTLTATFSATTPLFGGAFGIFMLGEHFTLPIAIGTVTIIVALIVLSWRGKIQTLWPVWALAFPLGAAIVRAAANAFVKVGLVYVPEPFYVGFIGYTVSFVIAVGLQVVTGKPFPNFAQRPGLLWCMAAGTCHAFAVMMVNTALKLSPVIIVLPLVSIYPFFVLALSLLVFRKEVLTTRTVIAVLLVVPGVLLIGIAR
jgi:DME family drug/metabolite transporter